MDKKDILKIQHKARKLMSHQFPPRGKRISILYYYILEDANFHSENNFLTKSGNFGAYKITKYPDGDIIYSPNSYGSAYAEYLYKKYKKLGGKTWEL